MLLMHMTMLLMHFMPSKPQEQSGLCNLRWFGQLAMMHAYALLAYMQVLSMHVPEDMIG